MVTVIDNYMMNGFVRSYNLVLDAIVRVREYVRKLDDEGASAMETLLILGAVVIVGGVAAALIVATTQRAANRVSNTIIGTASLTTQ